MLAYRLNEMQVKWLNYIKFDNGYILEKSQHCGRFESEELHIKNTNRMVLSWNVVLDKGSYIELFIKTKFEDQWSPWMTYGKWCGAYSKGSIANQSYEFVELDIDEIISNQRIDTCQIAFELTRSSKEIKSPIVNDLFLSIEVEKTECPQVSQVPNIDLEVPKISQMLIKDIGSIACSPTALTMVLNYYGQEADALNSSINCYDVGADIYGNWAYNVAFAGSRHLEAYVDYCNDISELIAYIKRGVPIVTSVKTDEIIDGSPQAYPEGHLLVVRGFSQKDEPYIIVNDPASKNDEDVKRYYKLDSFIKIWRNVIYVVKTKKRAG